MAQGLRGFSGRGKRRCGDALDALWFGVAVVFRWRFQFSLRSLLVMVVVVALPFSWLAVEIKKAKEQKVAAAAIQKAGGFVWYDFELDSLGDLVPNRQRPGPQWLRRLLGDHFFDAVTSAYVWDDVAMTYLAQLPRLQELFLISNLPRRNTPPPRPINHKLLGGSTTTLDKFSASGRRSIEDYQSCNPRFQDWTGHDLQSLPLPVHLRNLCVQLMDTACLCSLRNGRSELAVPPLQNLRALTQLRVLSLEGDNIQDAALEHIEGLTQLTNCISPTRRSPTLALRSSGRPCPTADIDH